MATKQSNSYNALASLTVDGTTYRYVSLKAFADNAGLDISRLPYSLKILLENLLRREDGVTVKKADIEAIARWDAKAVPQDEIQFMPARILLQDFTGVPAVADLAAMRAALKHWGGQASHINPLQPADLIIDHSVQVDSYGTSSALETNSVLEFERNHERYQFLRWGQSAFTNFRVVPPATGICHQVNLEYLSQVAVVREEQGESWLFPDTLVGTDSHTTMINGLGVVGWGVGGIEAEAAMLGQPISMLLPQVIGFRLSGALKPGATATDLVLTITQLLRKKGVVGKFVEFFGPGAASLTVADRATISNMAPEYGATIGIFAVDEQTIDYLRLTNRAAKAPLVEVYCRQQGLWSDPDGPEPFYSDTLELDLRDVEPCLAGPTRPMDRVRLIEVPHSFRKQLATLKQSGATDQQSAGVPVLQPDNSASTLCHGSVVIAAITSCTNTSNPSVMIAAGLLARNAVLRGLKAQPWVKTSLAPGSKVVTDYLVAAGLMPYLEALGFNLVGYGCTTCIGNSGPLADHITQAVVAGDLSVAAVLSGNRNFEGRIHSAVRANYLASPPLVIAYALAGSVTIDLTCEPLGTDADGQAVYLNDLMPDPGEVAQLVASHVSPAAFTRCYADLFQGDRQWNSLEVPVGELYQWQEGSTYIKQPPFFADLPKQPTPVTDVSGARVLALLGDSITTDHISPAGSIAKNSPAGLYLQSLGIQPSDFNSYGSRRGNHEVMVRGTLANIRIRNQLVPGVEGGMTRCFPDHTGNGEQLSIFDAAMRYKERGIPLIVVAGKEYGTGSSRDWAAKGVKLLGVRAVLAESFERIHRSNLVGMGILPLQFLPGESAQSVGIDGTERFDLEGLAAVGPGQQLSVAMRASDGSIRRFSVLVRIDTPNELQYYRHGGILPFVLRQFVQ
ncbi:MAG: aconitate hydratase AcnA [Geobacter sp.]